MGHIFTIFLSRVFHLNQINKLANAIYSAVILNIHVIFSIIELVSIKRLTEDLLLIIDACRDTDTWSINKQLSEVWGANGTSDSKLITRAHFLNYLTQQFWVK